VTASGAALTVGDVTPPSFEMAGEAPGTSLVQLFQLGTSDLLDQVDLEAETISSVTLFPQDTILLFAESSPSTPFALLRGSTSMIPLVVRLHGTGTDRLVDEGTVVTSAQDTISQSKWDLFETPVPASAPQATFSVETGTGVFVATAPVVDTIDSIVEFPKTSPIQVGTTAATELCFTAQSAGALVAGATWTFSSSANLTVSTAKTFGCAQVQGQSVGTGTLTVTASGFAQTFDLTAVAGTVSGLRRPPHHGALRGVVQPTAGHRAEAAAATR
jgi:hypothetical protein